MRLQVPLTSSECALPKNSFLFPKLRRNFLELPLLFLELLFYFPEVPFCLLELSFYIPEVPFYFSRKPYCFPELLSSLPQVPSSYLLSASFSKNAFFLSWLYLLFVLLRAAKRDVFLAFVLLPLGIIYWSTYNALHLACVHIQAINNFQSQ